MEISKDHLTRVTNGLKALDVIFNKQLINYRVIGSILVASLNGKPHRILGDIDVILDEVDYKKVKLGLNNNGYALTRKQKYGFSWLEANHPNSLGFTFLLVGKFLDNYFTYKLSKNIELKISAEYLRPTKYSLLGISFTGIPSHSIYEGLKISSLNPKRSQDREIVINSLGVNFPRRATLDKSFKIYFRGLELPYTYTIFSQLYNIYGGIRVILGKKYEIWE